MNTRKASVEKALNNFYQNQLDKLKKEMGPKRKNERPEKLVEKECLVWMRAQGWDVQIFESKAVLVKGRYVQAGMRAGVCDCQGLSQFGDAVFVEFKAPGKRSAFNAQKNYRQKQYLVSKLNLGAFAVVVDSAEMLRDTFNSWRRLMLVNRSEAIAYLALQLPKMRYAKD